MRRALTNIAIVVAVGIGIAGGVLAGIMFADKRWHADMNEIGHAMQRLDQELKAGRVSSQDVEHMSGLCKLPLERFDDHSVTYYAGPFASSSVTIEFGKSGVKGFRLP